jgi:hypothetical protein
MSEGEHKNAGGEEGSKCAVTSIVEQIRLIHGELAVSEAPLELGVCRIMRVSASFAVDRTIELNANLLIPCHCFVTGLRHTNVPRARHLSLFESPCGQPGATQR